MTERSKLTNECLDIFRDFVDHACRRFAVFKDEKTALEEAKPQYHLRHFTLLARSHFKCDDNKAECGKNIARLLRHMPRSLGKSSVVAENFDRLPDREVETFVNTAKANRVIIKNEALKYCTEKYAVSVQGMAICFEGVRIFDELYDML